MPSQMDDAEASEDRPDVSALDSGADRTVFTEDGNRDGWISTDVTVNLQR